MYYFHLTAVRTWRICLSIVSCLVRKFFGFCVIGYALGATLSWSHGQERVITVGHYDMAVTYEPDSGWRPYIRDYNESAELSTTSVVWKVGVSALNQVPHDPAYSLLGNPGDPVWLLPEIYDADVVYLGMGAPLLGRNIFAGGLSNRGQITMRLLSVEGSGPENGGTVSMWQSGFPPRFYFSSADGIDSNDALDAITANFHAHYNWGFTAPGIYRMTFEYEGELLSALGGEVTSTQVVYTFDVGELPAASALRYAWSLGEGWVWSSWMGYVYTGFSPWIWNDRDGWSYLPPASPDNLFLWSFSHGWVWTSQEHYPWLLGIDSGLWIEPAFLKEPVF